VCLLWGPLRHSKSSHGRSPYLLEDVGLRRNQSHKHCRKTKNPAEKQNGKCKDQKFWLKSTLFSSCRRARRANCAAHPAPLTQNLRAKVGGGDGRPHSQGVTGVLLGNSRPGTHKNGKMRPQRTYQLPVLMPCCFPSSSGHQAPLRNGGGWLQWQVDKISANFQPCNQAEKTQLALGSNGRWQTLSPTFSIGPCTCHVLCLGLKNTPHAHLPGCAAVLPSHQALASIIPS
jgi:hypothetical protein